MIRFLESKAYDKETKIADSVRVTLFMTSTRVTAPSRTLCSEVKKQIDNEQQLIQSKSTSHLKKRKGKQGHAYKLMNMIERQTEQLFPNRWSTENSSNILFYLYSVVNYNKAEI